MGKIAQFRAEYPYLAGFARWLGNVGIFIVAAFAWGRVEHDRGHTQGVRTVIAALQRATDAMVVEGEKDRAAKEFCQQSGEGE